MNAHAPPSAASRTAGPAGPGPVSPDPVNYLTDGLMHLLDQARQQRMPPRAEVEAWISILLQITDESSFDFARGQMQQPGLAPAAALATEPAGGPRAPLGAPVAR